MVRLIKMLVVSLIPVCASGARADYEDGLAAARRGDYATAFKLVSPLAQKGHAAAQCALGVMYDGLQDYKEIAADQGLAQAQSNLGQYCAGL
jgi:uncharacterized protein